MTDTGVQDKLFHIKNRSDACFFAGPASNSRQMLFSLFGSDALVVFFAQEGEFLNYELIPMKNGEEIQDVERKLRSSWGFLPGEITIKRFYVQIPEASIASNCAGIREYFSSFDEILAQPSQYSEDDLQTVKESIEYQSRSGTFVLVWHALEIQYNRDGEIEST